MVNKASRLLIVAGISGFVSVALGAFAAHGLKSMLSPYLLSVFETGVRYQMIHTLALIACAIILMMNSGATTSINEKTQKALFRAAICFIIGIFCFSGSLYALALTGIKWFGPITPFGGVMFLSGWVFFVYSACHIREVTP